MPRLSRRWSLQHFGKRDRRFGHRTLLVLALAALLLAGVGPVVAAPGGPAGNAEIARAVGETRAEPVPLTQAGEAGPWRITVLEVVTGDAAAEIVSGARQSSTPLTDGFQYVAVRLRAENTGELPLRISGEDFGVTGASGVVWRFVEAAPPEPPLEGEVAPGAAAEGWIVGAAASGETSLMLLFDSLSLGGNWADRLFALEDGAAVPAVERRAVSLNRTGRQASAPAGIGEVVATREWAVEILEVAEGQAVYDLFPPEDYRTTALADSQGGANVPLWIAFRVRVTNNRTGDAPSFFPPTAFQLADSRGRPLDGTLTLTPPSPDLSGAYFPGGSREGWFLFERPPDANAALLRLQPFESERDVRYFSWSGTAPSAPSGPIEEGATVEVTESGVRMRAEPSTSAEIVTELSAGTRLTVTGPAEEADGFTWYPVENPETRQSGYVAADFLRPVA